MRTQQQAHRPAPCRDLQRGWKPVPGYEGLYEVSDGGQVYSVPRIVARGVSGPRAVGDSLMAGRINQVSGYRQVALSRDGKRWMASVHVLVLIAFVGPCPDGQEARHLNGNPADNRWPENLCWGTPVENAEDRRRHHGRHAGAKLTEERVRAIRARYAAGETNQSALAREFGVTRRAIQNLIKGDAWRYVT
jgi:NUMOD4 motif-containing protein/HNH endonuclease